jgi:hypothetical protein
MVSASTRSNANVFFGLKKSDAESDTRERKTEPTRHPVHSVPRIFL